MKSHALYVECMRFFFSAVAACSAALIAGACASANKIPVVAAEPMPEVAGVPASFKGIRIIDVEPGAGDPVMPHRCVYAHFTGWLANGRRFDSSHDLLPDGSPGEPIGFQLGNGQVIRGWDIGFEGLRVGARRRLYVPFNLGYGSAGRRPGVPPRSDLVFDIEIKGVADTLPHRPYASARPGDSPVIPCRPWRALNSR